MALTKVTDSMLATPPTAYDDAGLRNDISTLALHSAIADNKAAYNLSNAFIDQYEDSTGIDATTNTSRSTSGEYMASIVRVPLTMTTDAVENSTSFAKWGTSSFKINYVASTASHYIHLKSDVAFASGLTNWTLEGWIYQIYSNDYYWLYRWSDTDPLTTTPVAVNGARTYNPGAPRIYNARYNQANSIPDATGWSDTQVTTTDTTWKHFALNRVGDYIEAFYDGTRTTSVDLGTSAAYSAMPYFMLGNNGSVLRFHADDWRLSNTNRYAAGSSITVPASRFTSDSNTCFLLQSIDMADGSAVTSAQEYGPGDVTVNATGNYTSTTETANATVSKMGIIVLYENTSGTATLDTDLVAQVSADGGSNYVSAPLTAGGTFSTGVLVAKSNDITISNTGTAPKYKISFANQADGSKETRIKGVALLY